MTWGGCLWQLLFQDPQSPPPDPSSPHGIRRQEGPISPSWAQSVQAENKPIGNKQGDRASVLQIKPRIHYRRNWEVHLHQAL